MLTHLVTFLWRNPGNWKKFANMNHTIEQDLGAQGWSLQPYSSSTDAYSLCLDPVAPRLAFLKINPRATTSQMSVSPSISTLTLTSPSDSSLQITIIPVENVKKNRQGMTLQRRNLPRGERSLIYQLKICTSTKNQEGFCREWWRNNNELLSW